MFGANRGLAHTRIVCSSIIRFCYIGSAVLAIKLMVSDHDMDGRVLLLRFFALNVTVKFYRLAVSLVIV